ncbi:MAG: DUF4350 domain-containing protein, partial [Bacteroidota bacterium]
QNSSPIYEWDDIPETAENLIFINSQLNLDPFETEILLDRVDYGDDLFIAVGRIGGLLADTLGIAMTTGFSGIPQSTSDLKTLTQKEFRFTNPAFSDQSWFFPKILSGSYFVQSDSSEVSYTVLATDDGNNPVFIHIPFGEGNIFLLSTPFPFTNYYMRDVEQYTFASHAISYLQNQPTLWDAYYKDGINRSRLEFILTSPNLKSAWFISLLGIVLFLLFYGRRVQRIIPILPEPNNTSIEFARTIGRLHFLQGSHAELLQKKAQFFYAYLRSNLSLSITSADISSDMKKDIAQRSGVPNDDVNRLFSSLTEAEQRAEITVTELKQISQQIDHFYTQTKR